MIVLGSFAFRLKEKAKAEGIETMTAEIQSLKKEVEALKAEVAWERKRRIALEGDVERYRGRALIVGRARRRRGAADLFEDSLF